MPAKSSIGGTAVQLTATSTPVRYAVTIRAATDNSGIIYIGYSNAVTANSNDTTDGFPLNADDGYEIPVAKLPTSNLTDIWVIGSASGQKVFFDYL